MLSQKLQDLLKEFFEDSPMKTFIVESPEELQSLAKEMKEKNFSLSCISNTGLTGYKRRVTFLPNSAFKSNSSEDLLEKRNAKQTS
jgi:hypothetical protein